MRVTSHANSEVVMRSVLPPTLSMSSGPNWLKMTEIPTAPDAPHLGLDFSCNRAQSQGAKRRRSPKANILD